MSDVTQSGRVQVTFIQTFVTVTQPTVKSALTVYRHFRKVKHRKWGKEIVSPTHEEIEELGMLDNYGYLPSINVMHF